MKIKKKDIIDAGVKKEFDAITKSVAALITELKALISMTNEARTSMQNETTTIKTLKKANDDLKKVNNGVNIAKKKGMEIQTQTIKANSNYLKSITDLNKEKKKAEKENVKAIKTNSAYFKTMQDLNKQREKSIREEAKLSKTTKATAGSIDQLKYANKQLLAVRNKINISDEKGLKQAEKINKQIDKNNAKIKTAQHQEEKRYATIGKYKEALESTQNPLANMSRGMTAIAKNPMILAITLIIGAFTALYKALSRSEEGQDKLNKILEVGGAIFTKLTDYITSFAIGIIDAFTSPKKAIADLWEAIKTNLLNRMNAVLKIFSAFGDAFNAALKFDKEGIKKAASEMGSAYVDALTGVENTLDKVSDAQKNLTAEITESAKAGQRAADIEAKLNKDKRKYLIDNAKIEGKVLELLAKAEEVKKKNAVEAIKLTKQAQKLGLQILDNNRKQAAAEYELLKARAAQGKNDIEMNNQIAAAQAKLIRADNAYSQKKVTDAKKINTLIAERKRQINETAMALRNSINETSKTEIAGYQKIIEADQATENAKLLSVEKVEKIRKQAIEESTKVSIGAYKSQLDANLITAETFAEFEKGLTLKKQNAITKIEKDANKQRTAIAKTEQQKRFDEETQQVVANQAEKINQVKILYAKNEITAKDASEKILDIEKTAAVKQIEVLEQLMLSEKLTADQRKLVAEELFKAKIGLIKEEEDATKESEEKKKQIREEAFAKSKELVDTAFNYFKESNERKLNDLEISQNAELLAAGDNEAAKQAINDRYNKERAKIQTKQAKADKAKALFDIAVATAVGIVKAYGNPWLIGLIASIGLLQAGIVAAKPIPQFDKGTKNAPRGGFIGGEKRPEFITKDGKTSLIKSPTFFGNEWAGAEITSGKESANILNNNLYDNFKLNQQGQEVTNEKELFLLDKINDSIKEIRTNVIFDGKGIHVLYKQSRSKQTRIDRYIS